jgi:hypothetical protein
MNATSTTRRSTNIARVPAAVWAIAVTGGVVGAFLAEAGDFWGNTIPSIATFFVAGLIVGLAGWAAARTVNRRR